MGNRYGGNLSSWSKVVREGCGRARAESKSADLWSVTSLPGEHQEIKHREPGPVLGYPQPICWQRSSQIAARAEPELPDGCCSLTQSWGLGRIFVSRSQDLTLCRSSFAGRPEGAAHLAECRYVDMSASINLPPSCSWRGSAQCQGLCSPFYWAHPAQAHDAPNRFLFIQNFHVNALFGASCSEMQQVVCTNTSREKRGTCCFALQLPDSLGMPHGGDGPSWAPQHLLWEPPDPRGDIWKSVRLF